MSRTPTNSLERALLILQCIANTPGGLTNLEISREFNIARSTCSYILSRLERERYLARDCATGKYRLGLKTVMLGRGALREIGFRVASEPTLYRLAAVTGLAANLAVLEGDRVLILDRIEGWAFVKAAMDESGKASGPVRPNIAQGLKYHHRQLTREYREPAYELPACTTALGKVVLAGLPTAQVAAFVDHIQSTNLKWRESDFSKEELLADLAKVREQGYCMMQFEPHNESCALAAPIFDSHHTVRAAVSVSCKRHLAVWNDEPALSELVKEAAWEISHKLQYHKGGFAIPREAESDHALPPHLGSNAF